MEGVGATFRMEESRDLLTWDSLPAEEPETGLRFEPDGGWTLLLGPGRWVRSPGPR